MRAENKLGIRVVKMVDGLVNLATLAVILLLVALSLYAMWDSNQVFNAADAAQYEIYKPSEEDTMSFDEMRALNPEVFAWLDVYGTNISYPVAQAVDNDKYVDTNVYGEYSLSGALFLDCRNSNDFSDFNSIIYGHHMDKNAMFGEIGLFGGSEYFNARQYGNLFYGGKNHGLEFIAFLRVDAYDMSVYSPNVQDEEQQQAYLDNILSKALHTRNASATIRDRLVLLSTCSSESTNGRDILVAKITDEVYEDPFALQVTEDTGPRATVDAKGDWWELVPSWAWEALAALLILLAGIAIGYRWGKRQG